LYIFFAFQIGESHQIPEPPKDFPKDCGPFEEPPFGDVEDDENVPPPFFYCHESRFIRYFFTRMTSISLSILFRLLTRQYSFFAFFTSFLIVGIDIVGD
jgi:hypothetical protein